MTNEENKTNTTTENSENNAPGMKTVTVTKTVTIVDIPEIECEEEGVRDFSRRINEHSISIAEEQDSKPTNPVRRNEVVVADECSGNLKEFKSAFYKGLYTAPSGLEKISYRPDGFVSRDGNADSSCLAAKQFVVTLKRHGKWETLPRFLATDEGGRFALSASQTLKAARILASHLNFVWLKGGDAKLLTKKNNKK